MAFKKRSIPLFWWSEIKFSRKDKENFGDLLSKYIVKKVSREPVKWVQPGKFPWYKRNKRNYLAVGSIIHHANKDSIVWGSGIIDRKQQIAKADFRAVRGPKTRNLLLEKGYDCPEVYGDPGLLLPVYYKPKVQKKYKFGIIPHYLDFEQTRENFKDERDILVIDMMTMDIEATAREFLLCERTISSSLHGLIISHAYEIPSVWVEFSRKLFGDGIKFRDYFESVKIHSYVPDFQPEKIPQEKLEDLFLVFPSLPSEGIIEKLQEDLLKANPFKIMNNY